MEKLKPCPFCGGNVKKQKGPVAGIIMFLCEKCGAVVCFHGAEGDQKATKAWNRRDRDDRQCNITQDTIEVKMNYKKKLDRLREALDCEIGKRADPLQLAFLHNLYASGEMTDEDCIEIRGYYNGLKVAMEILERILDTEE